MTIEEQKSFLFSSKESQIKQHETKNMSTKQYSLIFNNEDFLFFSFFQGKAFEAFITHTLNNLNVEKKLKNNENLVKS